MKTRKFIMIMILIFFLLIFVGSCATTKFVTEPDESTKTLLVGQIMLEASGFDPVLHVNGIHKSNIEIHFEDTSTGELIKLTSRRNGYFYIVNPGAGKYRIIKVYTKIKSQTTGRQYTQTLWMTIRSEGNFNIANGKVNNLGLIHWIIDIDSDRWEWKVNAKYNDIITWFKESYYESSWIDREWINVSLL